MRVSIAATTVLTFAVACGPSWAAPATPEGAKQIVDAYAAWFSAEAVSKGVVAVAPQGDDYLVTWDLQKVIDAATPPEGDVVTIGKFTYLLTPKGDEAWTVKAGDFPPVAFDVATDGGKAKGTIAVTGFKLDATYDPRQPQLFVSSVATALVGVKAHIEGANGPGDIDVSQSEGGFHLEATSSAGGFDVTAHQDIKGFVETITSQEAKDSAPVNVKFTAAGAVSDVKIADLRGHEIATMWKYLVAHSNDEGALSPELRRMLAEALPVWRQLDAKAEARDIAIDVATSVAPATLTVKSFGEVVAMSGLNAHSFFEFGFKVGDLTVKSPLPEAWSKGLQPVSFDIDVKGEIDGLDQVAKLALDDPNFGSKEDLTAETQDKIKAIVAAGHPRLIVAPGHFKTPSLDLGYDGDMAVEGEQPKGRLTLSADSLDKVQALIQDIGKTMPDAEKGLLMVAFVKGLSKTGADGRLVWTIEFAGDGSVTVNGAPMPMQ